MGRSGHALKVQIEVDKNVLPSVLRRRAYLSKVGVTGGSMLQYVAVCCSVLKCVALRCSVLQCVAVSCNVLQCLEVWCGVL